MTMNFSSWYHWVEREKYPGIGFPGLYAAAITDIDFSGAAFSYQPETVYIGMSNALGGLRGRLRQFDNTVKLIRCEHGGADRVLFRHQDYGTLLPRLFVALWHVECDPASESPAALRSMGQVACSEFEAFACFKEKHGMLPEFNRKRDSPKYTARVKRF